MLTEKGMKIDLEMCIIHHKNLFIGYAAVWFGDTFDLLIRKMLVKMKPALLTILTKLYIESHQVYVFAI